MFGRAENLLWTTRQSLPVIVMKQRITDCAFKIGVVFRLNFVKKTEK